MDGNVVTLFESPNCDETASVTTAGGGARTPRKLQQFAVDVAMDSSNPESEGYVCQESCYELIGKRVLEQTLGGYNTCLFCYGQTGTGKTTTIMGENGQELQRGKQGILVRLIQDLFEKASEMQQEVGDEVKMKVTMLEIYNDKLVDLIAPVSRPVRKNTGGGGGGGGGGGMRERSSTVSGVGPRRSLSVPERSLQQKRVSGSLEAPPLLIQNSSSVPGSTSPRRPSVCARAFDADTPIPAPEKIEVRAHPEVGVYITGAREEVVASSEDCLDLLVYGNSQKTVHATAMNANSSRGHTIFKMSLDIPQGPGRPVRLPLLYFVDLAGYENERTTLVTGERKRELAFINTSLFELARCIQALAPRGEGRRRTWTKKGKSDLSLFRSNKLTLLLSASLTGNSRTTMLGMLSPAMDKYEGNLKTLNFANSVKGIKLAASAIDGEEDRGALVKKLEAEIQQLKLQLESAISEGVKPSPTLRAEEQEALDQKEAMLASLGRGWNDLALEKRRQVRERDQTMVRTLIASILNAPGTESNEVSTAERYVASLLHTDFLPRTSTGQLENDEESARKTAEEEMRATRSFLLTTLRAKKMVDQANVFLRYVAPDCRRSFELVAKAPLLAFGGTNTDRFPDLVVQLTRGFSRARIRWQGAFQKILLEKRLKNPKADLLARVVRSYQASERTSDQVLLHMWTWAQFEERLNILAKLHTECIDDPDEFNLHKPRGVWADEFLKKELFADFQLNSDKAKKDRSRPMVGRTSSKGSLGGEHRVSVSTIVQPLERLREQHNQELFAIRNKLDFLQQASSEDNRQVTSHSAMLSRRLEASNSELTSRLSDLRKSMEDCRSFVAQATFGSTNSAAEFSVDEASPSNLSENPPNSAQLPSSQQLSRQQLQLEEPPPTFQQKQQVQQVQPEAQQQQEQQEQQQQLQRPVDRQIQGVPAGDDLFSRVMSAGGLSRTPSTDPRTMDNLAKKVEVLKSLLQRLPSGCLHNSNPNNNNNSNNNNSNNNNSSNNNNIVNANNGKRRLERGGFDALPKEDHLPSPSVPPAE